MSEDSKTGTDSDNNNNDDNDDHDGDWLKTGALKLIMKNSIDAQSEAERRPFWSVMAAARAAGSVSGQHMGSMYMRPTEGFSWRAEVRAAPPNSKCII